MNENLSQDDFEARLRSVNPAESSVTPGTVLFQAGWQQGLARQKNIQRKSLRWWQLATVGSMLLASVSIVAQFRTSGDIPNVANFTDESSQAPLPIDVQPANRTDESPVGRQNDHDLAHWSLFAIPRNSDIFRRQFILRRGVEGLPEPGFVTMASFGETASNRQSLMNELRLERGTQR